MPCMHMKVQAWHALHAYAMHANVDVDMQMRTFMRMDGMHMHTWHAYSTRLEAHPGGAYPLGGQ